MKHPSSGSASDRVPAEPQRARSENDNEQKVVAEGAQQISVEKCVESTSHATSRAIETGCGPERACGEKLCRVGVNDTNGNASSKRNASRNPHPGSATTDSRRSGRRRRALVRRIDGVRQHISSLGLASP